MKEEMIEKMQTQTSAELPSHETSLVLKVVRIEHNKPSDDLHSNPCDNCDPWTSCCDHS